MTRSMACASRQQGFTLLEMILVIVILGVVFSMVAVFMKNPIDAYFASAQRAALTDVADLTVRRIARDVRSALPNSIGPVSPDSQCIEFIPTKTGARYLADDSANALKFNTPVTSFSAFVLNSGVSPATSQIAVNDWMVVYNLGVTGSDAYHGDNVAKVTGFTEPPGPPTTQITITSQSFPLPSGSKRFHVVPANEQSVAYACDLGAGQLVRRSAQSFTHLCGGGATTRAVLANGVTACNFQYSGSDLQRNGLVGISLQLTNAGETVSLQQDVHVDNTP
jgi:MSHA biogenesis protein MshO